MNTDTVAQLVQLLASPNNILAIEYMKAIRRQNLKLTPSVVTRMVQVIMILILIQNLPVLLPCVSLFSG